MHQVMKETVALVTCGPRSRSHFNSLGPLLPPGTTVDIESLELYGADLYAIEDKKEIILEKTRKLVRERNWRGVMMVAAPTEVLNPGLLDGLRATAGVPVTTALDSCVAALRAYNVRKVLLLTPFDARLNALIQSHLGQAGITAVAPRPFQFLGDAIKLTPEEVFEHTRRALEEVGPVDAVYFQGAVLDPLKVLNRIEEELQTTVIASNPAMLWCMLSRLGEQHSVNGYGKLLREWPRAE